MSTSNNKNLDSDVASEEMLHARLERIEEDIRQVRHIQDFTVAGLPNKDDLIRNVFEKRSRSADLYIALEKGPLAQAELLKILGLDVSNISRICNYLLEANLIQIFDLHEKPQRYAWSALGRKLKAHNIAKEFASK